MNTRKRCMEFISFYNHTGLEKHFTKMAKKGWMIEHISNFYWTYRKIEPKDLHFCVTYYPRSSDFDPGPSPKQQTFYDFCAHTGWEFICTWHQMQVFCNARENPIPLDTDPVIEVETIHEACKRNFLPSSFILLALAVFQIVSVLLKLFEDPIGGFSNSSWLFTGFCFFCVAAINTIELGAYFIWYRKAKKAAQDGIFVDTPSTAKLQLGILILLLMVFVLWLLDLAYSDKPILLWVAVSIFAGILAVILIVNGIKQALKKANASKSTNRFWTTAAYFVLVIAMTSVIMYFPLSADRSEAMKVESIPLSLGNLITIDADEYETNDRNNESFLLGHRVVTQDPRFGVENADKKPDLLYVVTSIQYPFLYNVVKDQYFHGTSDDYFAIRGMDYDKIDAAPWKAIEAYRQIDSKGKGKTSFLLCYESRIVLIHLDWEPTGEQKAVIGRKLNP